MKKMRLVLCMIFFVSCLVACSKNDDILGIDITDGTITEHVDSHGGFHGDGDTYLEIYFHDDTTAASIADDMAKNNDWSALPLPENLQKALYGTLVIAEEDQATISEIKGGYYYFYDRHSESKDPKDDTNLLNRHSYNFTIALYDTNDHILYYYKLDT